ncbi:MAG TPA: HDOD domain-containing protein [Plasticicumulans sp.]|uniref:EAL and HDOD domain-containing protein n=1 Tax=Plasticicumulans sp. TaxID=2307179 RepID=UPI002CC30028|nr:HDOD domain-containing protein [Plasticicumulans sp.]HMV39532.1 HDOD domain-containing protein [Plasticicumulans sp.]HMW30999.1 HDOD domain-containing protein [Plasticicumulans sp.]HMW43756.1 HDOD domain-containing protein [Plasticicumulans sp.]HMZ11435.1 HDOD domain-containing protein [Plasticicumulans sp.]HNB90621.1 HDOD domain-containing protein [Plasticicumulans sp.]
MSTPPLIARQPVYDARHHVLAWDIAHARAQHPAATPPAEPDSEAAEAAHFELLTGALLVAGLERLIGNGFGFLPVSAHTLLSPTLRLLPPLQVVLTLPAAGLQSVDLPARLAPLQRAGYRVALDGCRSLEPGLLPLLPDLDFLRLDAAALGAAALAPLLQSLRGAGFHGVAIATGIADAGTAQAALDAGVLGLQGPLFRRPQPVAASALDTGREAALTLIAALNRPDAGLPEISNLIRRDATLTYKLLRYVGSAWFGLGEVHSVDHALICLGRLRLRLWATLVAMTGAAGERHDLLELALVRAGMCRDLLLAEGGDAETGTLAGLLSTLDLLFGLPLERVLAGLPLNRELRQALLEHAGPAGRALALALAYERGDWEEVHAAGRDEQVFDAYFAALAQAHETLEQIGTSH